jgi:cytochrome P450
MTKPKVVFSPVSQEYFENPYEVYKRMRDDAPLYYDEEEDFYALTRHEDVAAAFKDHEGFSSARGCDLGMVRSGEVPQKSIIFMDPPDHRHMRSLVNKAFTPRAIQAQKDTVVELIQHYLGKVDPDGFDVVQDFSGPFPVEVITRMAGVPEDFRQQVRHWIDTSLQRKPGQIDMDDDNMQANIASGMYYLPSWSAVRWWSSPAIPTSGRCCSTTAARSPPQSRNSSATSAPCSTTCATA